MDGHGAAGLGPARLLSPTPGTVTGPTGDPDRERFSARLRRLADPVGRASSGYEYLFWEMAWSRETWPV